MRPTLPTLQHVADACDVTVMTVTRALRSGSSVSAETRTKVLQAAERLGYHPRPNLGRPRNPVITQRTGVDVVLGQHVASEFLLALLESISRELGRRQLDCVIRTPTGSFEDFIALCNCMRADRELPTLVVGYLPSRQLEVVLEARPNAVLVDHTGDPAVATPCHSIGFDNAEAARLVTRHLLTSGRKRILLINGFAGHYFTREVAQGYRDALAEHGLAVDPALVAETDFTPGRAAAVVADALDRGLAFDAVVTNDEMALAVLGTLQQRGRRVPSDIAVAGLDGLPLGEFLVPSLTTARLDYPELGRLAVACACDETRLSSIPIRRRLLPQLCLRNSTKES